MSNDLKKKLFTKHEVDIIQNMKTIIRKDLETHLRFLFLDKSVFVVAGGCFASLINDPANSYNDLDIFILGTSYTGEHPAIRAMRQDTKFKELGKEYKDNNGDITAVFSDTKTKLQYIFTKYKTRQEVIKNFDFVHCMISYEPNYKDKTADSLYLSREMFDAASKKVLIANKPKDKIKPARWQKFKDRGYHEAVGI